MRKLPACMLSWLTQHGSSRAPSNGLSWQVTSNFSFERSSRKRTASLGPLTGLAHWPCGWRHIAATVSSSQGAGSRAVASWRVGAPSQGECGHYACRRGSRSGQLCTSSRRAQQERRGAQGQKCEFSVQTRECTSRARVKPGVNYSFCSCRTL